MSHCTVANANNVGIFVDDHAQVSILECAVNLLRFTSLCWLVYNSVC